MTPTDRHERMTHLRNALALLPDDATEADRAIILGELKTYEDQARAAQDARQKRQDEADRIEELFQPFIEAMDHAVTTCADYRDRPRVLAVSRALKGYVMHKKMKVSNPW